MLPCSRKMVPAPRNPMPVTTPLSHPARYAADAGSMTCAGTQVNTDADPAYHAVKNVVHDARRIGGSADQLNRWARMGP